MGGVDHEVCRELLGEVIAENGDIVGVVKAGGAGGASKRIYLFKDRYWELSGDAGLVGPFDNLEAALDEGFLTVTAATESIFCSALDGETLLARLRPMELAQPLSLAINGEIWSIAPDGSARKGA
jgi:hypothetical protein